MACKLVRVGHRFGFTRELNITSSISNRFVEEKSSAEVKARNACSTSNSASGFSRLHLHASCLRECINFKDLAHGRIIHTLAITYGFAHNTLLCNLLLQLYGCCLTVEDANATFRTMPRRNLLSFNYMLSAHLHIRDAFSSIQVFQHMQLQGVVPNKITFIIMLSVCAHNVLAGKNLHALIVERLLTLDVYVSTAVVTMYEKTGSLKDAHKAFDLILERNAVSWNAMLSANCHHGHGAKAMHFFYQMLMEGILPTRVTFVCLLYEPSNLQAGQQVHVLVKAHECRSDIVVENALINLYGKYGRLEDAERLYKETSNSNVITYNAMIDAYVHNGMNGAAYQCFVQMHVECLVPNNVTFLGMLSLCAFLGTLEKGRQMHACIANSSGVDADVVLKTSLINMYGKCGCIVASRREFDEMRTPNITSWNTMLAAYAQHGQGEEAEVLFRELQLKQVVPDEVTFVGLLSACTHGGLVDKACQYFTLMKSEFGIKASLEHYHCIIDLLGRAGRLDEMEVLLAIMPFEANGTSWMTLLGACRTHFDIQRGANAAENVYAREPENAAPFLMLSSMQGLMETHACE